ncbi:MAG TPA: hypothetical protein VE998_09240, partial [Terriglobales bacterium]|nr:hypothetical protein [Terriglobales bacterium]
MGASRAAQKGGSTDSNQWRTRSYSYDGLSRLVSAATPETSHNPTQYFYTTSTGGLCAGDPMKICRQTDPRNITTTYTYDAENRLTGKTYSNSTPAVTYYYDQSTY